MRCGLSRGVLGLEIWEWTPTKIHSQRGANAWALNGTSAPLPPFDVEMMSWRLLRIETYLERLNESLLVKGGLSCKSEWIVGRSTCSFTVGIAIFSHTERQRRSVFLKFNDTVVVSLSLESFERFAMY